MRLLLFLLFSSFLPSFHAQSCTTVYGESARCDVATACPAQGGTSGYVAQDEKLCPTISGVTKVCCLNFKLTDAMQVYDATAAPWQPAALQDWQQSAMNFFPDVMQKFACMYRNIPYVSSSTNCGTTISLTAVAEYYQNLSHQIDALNYLQNVVEGWLITYPDGMNQAWLIYIRMIRGYRNTLDPMKWIKPTSTPIPSTPPIGTCRKAAAATYTLSQNGLNVIKHFESWFACCYTDSVGVRTVGYGHACHVRTNLNDGSGCGPGLNQCSGCISRSLGESILAKDMLVYSSCVKSAIKVPITQNQYDALVSFAFNVGCQGMATSSLVTLLNQGSLTKAQAQYQLSRWHSGCLEGLKRRRYAEALLFNSCDAIGSFPCSEKGCSISYGYNKCASNCQYCSACGGCTSSSTSETSKAAAFSTFAALIMETCPIGEYAEIDKPCIVSGDMASSYQCTTAGMTSNTTTIGTCTNNQLIPSYNTSLPLETCTSSTSGIISYTRFDRYDGLDIDELNHISIDPILHARITIRRGYDGQIPNVRLITYASTQQLAQAVYVHTISSSQDGGMEGLLLKADGEAHSFTDTGGNSGRPINTGSRSSGSLSAFSHLATALVTGVTLSRSPSWGLLTGAAASTLYMSQVDAAPSCTTYTEMTIVLNPIDYAFAMTAINDGRLIVNATIVTTNPNTPSQPDAIDCLDAAVTYVFPTLCASFQPSSTDTTSITALSSNQPMAAISQGPLLLSNAFLYYNPTLSPHQTCAFNWLQSALGNTPEIRTFACEYRNKIATSTDPTCGEPINLINAATSYNPSIVHQQNAITTLQSKLEIRTEIWSTFVTYYRQQQICIDWIIRVDGRCGIKFDNAGCSIRDDTCCSVGGWCGDTDDHCNPTKGGYDWKQGRPTIATTTTTTPPTIPAATQTITGNACFSNHPSNGKPGVCISSSTCTAAGGITAKGLCPGDANILCCGGDNVNIKLVVNQDVCGSYASSPTFQIAGNDGTYTVVKILRAHLTDPSAYDAAPTDRDNTLKANVACHYDKMRAAAAQDGVSIKISSGFRTVARQQYFYRCSNAGCCCCNGCALAAPPGTSNHGYGIAMDLNTNCGSQDNISGCRSSSPVYRWLAANAAAYGFRRAVVSEPWHWEYHGVGTVKTSYT